MQCLICLSNVPVVVGSNEPQPSTSSSSTTQEEQLSNTKKFNSLPTLDKNLFVIFVLSKVLHIPANQLEEFLRVCPEVENWFRLCEGCLEVLDRSRNEYNEIIKVIRRYKELQREIVNTVKVTNECYDGQDGGYVMSAVRNFVVESDYTEILNPFALPDIISQFSLVIKSEVLEPDESGSSEIGPIIESVSGAEQDPLLQNQNYFERVLKIEMNVDEETGVVDNDTSANLWEESFQPEDFADHEMELVQGLFEEFSEDGEKKIGDQNNESSDSGQLVVVEQQQAAKLKKTPKRRRSGNGVRKKKIDRPKKEESELVAVKRKSNPNKPKPQSDLTCSYCDKVCTTNYYFKLHLLLHTNAETRPFKCNLCEKRYPRKDILRCHVRRRHEIAKVGLNKCPEKDCGRYVDNSTLLEQHMSVHGAVPKLKCTTCSERFYFPHALSRHEGFHSRGVTPPPKLPPLTRHLNSLATAMKLGSVNKKKPTSNAGKSPKDLKTKSSKQQARKREKSLKINKTANKSVRMKDNCPVTSSVGGKRSPNSRVGEAQRKKGTTAPFTMPLYPIKCRVKDCGKLFYDDYSRNVHMARHRKKMKIIRKCELCDSMFYSKIQLARHVSRVHRPKVPQSGRGRQKKMTETDTES